MAEYMNLKCSCGKTLGKCSKTGFKGKLKLYCKGKNCCKEVVFEDGELILELKEV
jgi:hypothetical protein